MSLSLVNFESKFSVIFKILIKTQFTQFLPATKKSIMHVIYSKKKSTHRPTLVYLIKFVNNKAKRRYCVRYVRTLLFLILCYFSQGSIATGCRYGGKYYTNRVANLVLSPIVKNLQDRSINLSK